MRVYYNGTDITEYVEVKSCIVRDLSGDKCDSINIVFENADTWFMWGTDVDDQIYIVDEEYESGAMYVNTVLPEDNTYRVLATALPERARNKGNNSFINMSLEEIMRSCAAISNMGYQIYGIDKDIIIPYIERRNEGCAAFLSRLLTLEGAVLKCINGNYVAIGIEYTQSLSTDIKLMIDAEQSGVRYMRKGKRARQYEVYSPYASATAVDVIADGITISESMPVLDVVQAGRWARNKLLSHNMDVEHVYMSTDLNSGYTSMIKIEIEGNTDATGEWLVKEVEHDLIRRSTFTTLMRCINTIQ